LVRTWPFLAAVLSAAVVLAIHRHAYWRPFDHTVQDSNVSLSAYSFAAASTADLWPNPVVARILGSRTGRIRPYTHWPNGFFLVLEGALRVFGRTEAVGRSVAICGALLGFLLVAAALGRDYVLVYAAVPWILLSAPGRDGIPVVFADAALYAWIGILFWTCTCHDRHAPFRAALVIASFFNHLIAPYAASLLLLRWWERRSRRDLILDATALAGGLAVVLVCLAAPAGGFPASGPEELLRVYQARAAWSLPGWFGALSGDLRQGLNLGAATSFLVGAAWLWCLRARAWRTAVLLPSYLLFSLLFRQYVVVHPFARLPFVFFCLVTVAAAIELLIERWPTWRRSEHAAVTARVAVALLLAVPISGGLRQYHPDPQMESVRRAMAALAAHSPLQTTLQRCGAFDFHPELRRGDFDPYGRWAVFFFGRHLAERAARGDAVQTCLVDVEKQTVRLLPNGELGVE
jgi:hypothetical protein